MTLKHLWTHQAPPFHNDDVNPSLTFTCTRSKTKRRRREEKLPGLAPQPQ